MFTKIKTEIAYYKTLIIFLYLCIITAWIYHLLWSWGTGMISTGAFISISTTMSLIFMANYYATWITTKRERFYIFKPGSVRETGIVRQLIPIGFWLIPAVSVFVADMFLKTDPGNMMSRYLLSVTGILLIINSNFYIVKDMAFVLTRKRAFFGIYIDQLPSLVYFTFISTVIMIIVLSFMGTEPSDSMNSMENPIERFLDRIFEGFAPVVLLVSGFIFTYISLRIYKKRLEFQD